jgi:vanillate O-demethylase monooxygenase subunit
MSNTTTTAYADAHTPLVRNCWYVAGLAGDFTRELKERYLLGDAVVLYRTGDGTPVVMQNRCAHRSFPLSHGRLEGDDVVCLYHGLRYDPQGRCVEAPMIKRAAAHAKLRRYPTVERGPLVWAWMGDAALADESKIPDTGWLDDPRWASRNGYVYVKANYIGLQENLLDLTHFSYLHAGNVGTPEWVDCPFEVTVEGEKVHSVRRLDNAAPPMIYAVPMGLTHRERVNRISDSWYVSPAMHVAYATIEDLDAAPGEQRDYHVNILHLVTPETQHTMHYWAFIGHDFRTDDSSIADALRSAALKAFDEDREALEWIDVMNRKEGWPKVEEASFASDRGSLAMRRIIAQLAQAEQPPQPGVVA